MMILFFIVCSGSNATGRVSEEPIDMRFESRVPLSVEREMDTRVVLACRASPYAP